MSSEKESLLTDDINDEYGINENEKDQFINRVKLLGFAKSIKLWAGIEFIYDIYLTFSLSWVYIFFSFFSFGGWYGAKKLDKSFIFGYFASDIAKLFAKFILVFYTNDIVTIVITSILTIMNIVYLITIYKFYKTIKNTDDDDLNAIREGWSPRVVQFLI